MCEGLTSMTNPTETNTTRHFAKCCYNSTTLVRWPPTLARSQQFVDVARQWMTTERQVVRPRRRLAHLPAPRVRQEADTHSILPSPRALSPDVERMSRAMRGRPRTAPFVVGALSSCVGGKGAIYARACRALVSSHFRLVNNVTTTDTPRRLHKFKRTQ
ncbi:hypothetical protein H310_10227 [Aphanomyces invadans]|uniref:Uncharacterized protein n=1 Tax=Aphanomyces invadans TaxID=157072 RepID=A0A024TR84_9STRA|nr:hypothetical protein H310_10227 [Aphanomyces invadans]ETV96499.1 hypothetical protein H310_10227 [Aphanomyces invadans]|eukprot:XP_008874762.1 hypothetical protein H310_10227 [Aphanomyces invadans]